MSKNIFQTLTYVAEITQPSLRGILASTSTIAVISGTLIQFILGTFFRWKTVALMSCIVPTISYVLLFFVPESPHWLITRRRFTDARRSLAWLRGWVSQEETEREFEELSEQICKNREDEPPQDTESTWKLYFKKSFLWPYSLVCFAFFLGHFSGMTTLQTYAVKIFAAVQSPIDKFHATIILGAVEVCGCILSACLVHYLGKRTMNFISLIGNACCFLTVATYAHCSGITDLARETGEGLESSSWIPTVFLIGTAFFSHCGIRILPWMLVGEVYSNETRATGSGLSGGASYIFGFASNKIFLSMVAVLTLPGTFWTYSCVSVVGLIVLYFFLPETEGKTLYEITQHFASERKLDNKVSKKRKEAMEGTANAGFTLDCAPDNCEKLDCNTPGGGDVLEMRANITKTILEETGKRKLVDVNHA